MVKIEELSLEEVREMEEKGGRESKPPFVLMGVKEEIKEEEEDLGDSSGIGEAMRDFLRRRGEGEVGSSSGGLIPGVEALPHGRVPELLGFSEEEILQMFPGRAAGPSVPYVGDGNDRRSKKKSGSSSRSQVRSSKPRGGFKRPKAKQSFFGSGRTIRAIGGINREDRNRPLQMVCRETNLPIVPSYRPKKPVMPFSYHRLKYNESSEPFSKTGRYHPEDGRLRRDGVWDAIAEDIGLHKIPPAWWPEPLTHSDFYSSSSSDAPSSPGMYDMTFFLKMSFPLR